MEKVFSVLAVAAVIWWNLGGAIWDSWSYHRARLQAEERRVELIRKDGYELVFSTVCPDYYEQNWLSRQIGFRSLRWCEDFRDRF